jgi:nickel/cobalt transporter (NicO) family protein
MKSLSLATFLILSILSFDLWGQAQNPFRTKRQPTVSADTTADSTTSKYSTQPTKDIGAGYQIKPPFSASLYRLQQKFISTLSNSVKKISTQNSFSEVLWFLLAAFVYGIIHSLGPGHAKLLLSSQTLANPVATKQIWIAGTFFAATHAGTAILLFLILRLILGQSTTSVEAYSAEMLVVSAWLIILVGILIFVTLFLDIKRHSHCHSAPKRAIVLPGPLRRFSPLSSLAISAGIIPCPGTLLVLSFANLFGLVWLGIAGALSVSLGMAITVSGLATVSNALGNSLHKFTSPLWHHMHHILHALSGIAAVGIGILLLL